MANASNLHIDEILFIQFIFLLIKMLDIRISVSHSDRLFECRYLTFLCLFISALSQLWTTVRDAQRNNNKHRTNVSRNKDGENDQWIGEDVEIKDQKQKMRRGRIRTSCREFVCWMFLVLLAWIDAYHPFVIPSWNEDKLITILTTQTTM